MRYAMTVALLVLVCSSPIFAADGPRVEVSGAFSSLASGSCCLPTTGTTPVGWDSGIALDLTRWFAVVGTVGGNYETIQAHAVLATDDVTFSPESTRVYAFLGGPRLKYRAGHRANVFGQVLFGTTHREWTVNDPVFGELRGAVNDFALQPGGGVDLSLNHRWAVRLQADDRLTPMQGLVPARWAISQFRFATGIVFRP